MSDSPNGAVVRPRDDDDVSAADALQWQVEYVIGAGSPVSAQVLIAVRDDVLAGGPLAEIIPARARFGDLIGLRVMSALHRLALERQAPGAAIYLPTLGGSPPATHAQEGTFRREVVTALADHKDTLRRSLTQTPQTNETGRAALLRCVLSRLRPDTRVRLREIGSSAGLNLRADHLPGIPELESGPMPIVIDRVGCDVHPLDPTSHEGRVALTSYIWVDDLERFERLRRALQVAADVPAEVVDADAADFVEALDIVDGTTTVLWHSAMWVYLPPERRRRVLAAVRALGARATPSAPLVHASWEWAHEPYEAHHTFHLVVRRWSGSPDDGRPVALAQGSSHGRAVLLPGGDVTLPGEPLPA
ncbi:MAG: DUF2332 domain-containing protein [Actinobacteria bacterium]|nr:DUF2332 domain-containing protein [Actinomycetota bacterium]